MLLIFIYPFFSFHSHDKFILLSLFHSLLKAVGPGWAQCFPIWTEEHLITGEWRCSRKKLTGIKLTENERDRMNNLVGVKWPALAVQALSYFLTNSLVVHEVCGAIPAATKKWSHIRNNTDCANLVSARQVSVLAFCCVLIFEQIQLLVMWITTGVTFSVTMNQ